MTFDIGLGADVISNDFQHVGRVDGLVVDPDSMNMLEIIVQQGFLFATERIIDVIYVDRVDEDGTVNLNVDAARANEMPPFIKDQYVVANTAGRGSMPWTVGAGPTNRPAVWRASATTGRSMQVSNMAEYLEAVGEAAPVEVRSALPAASVVIDRGTDVIAAGGKKIGTVDDIVYNDSGELTGFVVRSGFFHHEDIAVPISSVAAVTHHYVRLNVDAEMVREG